MQDWTFDSSADSNARDPKMESANTLKRQVQSGPAFRGVNDLSRLDSATLVVGSNTISGLAFIPARSAAESPSSASPARAAILARLRLVRISDPDGRP